MEKINYEFAVNELVPHFCSAIENQFGIKMKIEALANLGSFIQALLIKLQKYFNYNTRPITIMFKYYFSIFEYFSGISI